MEFFKTTEKVGFQNLYRIKFGEILS